MKKETLEKMEAMLNEQITEQEQALYTAEESILTSAQFKNFVLRSVSNYSWSGDEEDYRIEFKHSSNEDVVFEITTAKEFANNYSWSSWGNYGLKTAEESAEAFTDAENYLTAELEKIQILKNDYAELKSYCLTIVDDWKNSVEVERKMLYKLKRELDDVKKELDNLQDEEDLEEAKKLFTAGTTHYFHQAREVTKTKDSYSFKFFVNAKGQLKYEDDYGTVRTAKDDFLLGLYKETKKIHYRYDFNDKSERVYYKYFNYTGLEQKQYADIKIEITEEEYKARYH